MHETRETWVRSLGQNNPLEETKAAHPNILAWRIHGQGSLEGYSPWSCTESDTTEQLNKSDLNLPLACSTSPPHHPISEETRLKWGVPFSGELPVFPQGQEWEISLERNWCLRDHSLHRLKPTELKPLQEFCNVTSKGHCYPSMPHKLTEIQRAGESEI